MTPSKFTFYLVSVFIPFAFFYWMIPSFSVPTFSFVDNILFFFIITAMIITWTNFVFYFGVCYIIGCCFIALFFILLFVGVIGFFFSCCFCCWCIWKASY